MEHLECDAQLLALPRLLTAATLGPGSERGAPGSVGAQFGPGVVAACRSSGAYQASPDSWGMVFGPTGRGSGGQTISLGPPARPARPVRGARPALPSGRPVAEVVASGWRGRGAPGEVKFG